MKSIAVLALTAASVSAFTGTPLQTGVSSKRYVLCLSIFQNFGIPWVVIVIVAIAIVVVVLNVVVPNVVVPNVVVT